MHIIIIIVMNLFLSDVIKYVFSIVSTNDYFMRTCLAEKPSDARPCRIGLG